MNILKIFGIVAGIHAIALTLIFANPGCSSSTAKPAETAASVPPKPDPAAVISAPDTGAASGSITAAPDAPPPAVGPFFAPTRPGTPAAAALESQPVSDVTPATTYTVVTGDSLWTVAKRNHLKVSELAAANNLRSGAALRLGQKLIIPSKASASGSGAPAPAAGSPVAAHASASSAKPSGEGTKHVVKPGETLGTIARKYGVRIGDLAMANAISDPQKIHPGQELTIPPGGRSPGGKSSKTPKGEAATSSAAPADTSAEAPGANQDLDAGLKPSSSSEVPVIKIENSPDASDTPASPSK